MTHELHLVDRIGCALHGPEEDSLILIDENAYTSVGISNLFKDAGAERIQWSHFSAFEYTDGGQPWAKLRQDYQAETGRERPKLYKIKISLELEELSEEEAAKAWEVVQNYGR